MLKELGYFLLKDGTKSNAKVSFLDKYEGKRKARLTEAEKTNKLQEKRGRGRPKKINETTNLTAKGKEE